MTGRHASAQPAEATILLAVSSRIIGLPMLFTMESTCHLRTKTNRGTARLTLDLSMDAVRRWNGRPDPATNALEGVPSAACGDRIGKRAVQICILVGTAMYAHAAIRAQHPSTPCARTERSARGE